MAEGGCAMAAGRARVWRAVGAMLEHAVGVVFLEVDSRATDDEIHKKHNALGM